MKIRRALALGFVVALALALAVVPAAAERHEQPRPGVSAHGLTLIGETGDSRPIETFEEAFFTDAAFQGHYVYQGTWNGGFRVVDIS